MSERNVVVLRGMLAADPRTRDLPSGSVLTQLDLTTRDSGGTHTVPVAWFDPPPTAATLAAGDELVVIGSVRRRFFRAGGSTQSRTEVVAEKVVPSRRARAVERAIDAVCELLMAPPDPVEEVAVAESG